jgi:hypothetical protein
MAPDSDRVAMIQFTVGTASENKSTLIDHHEINAGMIKTLHIYIQTGVVFLNYNRQPIPSPIAIGQARDFQQPTIKKGEVINLSLPVI